MENLLIVVFVKSTHSDGSYVWIEAPDFHFITIF